MLRLDQPQALIRPTSVPPRLNHSVAKRLRMAWGRMPECRNVTAPTNSYGLVERHRLPSPVPRSRNHFDIATTSRSDIGTDLARLLLTRNVIVPERRSTSRGST